MMKKDRTLLLFLLIAVLIITGVWVVQIVNGYVPYIDTWSNQFVETLHNSIIYQPFRLVTNLGSEFFLVPFVVVMTIVLSILLKKWFVAILFPGGILLTHQLNILIKSLVVRERPSISVAANAEGYSFPSGHAMISMVCYGLIAYLLVKKMKSHVLIFITQTMFVTLIFLIGISRYVIHVHYITDIVAGFALGFICLIGLIYVYERMESVLSRS
ncbi:phosphatase PAP2 family protein [Oceanobacillus sp. FSL K6-0127]|uniref:phosphatase PAP2 family protein n=1 Tax=Oceanobacillus sp. FSL K6-0127 TaxID=2921420 RepID=UPI0030EE0FFA|nr:phosphatase PAP2 family protein [Oceanobacillus sp.]